MKPTSIINILVAVCSITWSTAQFTFADHHEPNPLVGKIQQFYMDLSQGKFEAALSFVKTGSAGYMPYGIITDIPNEAAKTIAAAQMKEDREKGYVLSIRPKHINITMLGSGTALATYYVEGKEAQPEDVPKHVLNRATLVLAKENDDWQIVHWHISKLETESND